MIKFEAFLSQKYGDNPSFYRISQDLAPEGEGVWEFSNRGFITTMIHKARQYHVDWMHELGKKDQQDEIEAWDEYAKGGPSYRMVSKATLELVHFIRTPTFLMTEEIPLSLKPREYNGKLRHSSYHGYVETGLNLLLDGTRGEQSESPLTVLDNAYSLRGGPIQWHVYSSDDLLIGTKSIE